MFKNLSGTQLAEGRKRWREGKKERENIEGKDTRMNEQESLLAQYHFSSVKKSTLSSWS
jgi:hypothetical protein